MYISIYIIYNNNTCYLTIYIYIYICHVNEIRVLIFLQTFTPRQTIKYYENDNFNASFQKNVHENERGD